MNPSDIPIIAADLGDDGGISPADVERMQSALARLSELETAYDVAGGSFMGESFALLDSLERDYSAAVMVLAGKEGEQLGKAERRYDRARAAFVSESLGVITSLELARDDAARSAGCQPNMITSELMTAVDSDTLSDHLDKYYTLPMVVANDPELQLSQGSAVVGLGDGDGAATTLPPPPPFVFSPPPPPLNLNSPPPLNLNSPPPSSDPTCPPPFQQGNIVIRPGSIPPPGWVYVTSFPDGCREYKPGGGLQDVPPPGGGDIKPPPVVPPPVADPCVPPGTTTVGCQYYPPAWQSYYWYEVVCAIPCGHQVCVSVGPVAPVPSLGGRVYGPYQNPLTPAQLTDLLRANACDSGVGPPGVPPPPIPPTVPGVPPVVPPVVPPPAPAPNPQPQPQPGPAPVIKPAPQAASDLSALCGLMKDFIKDIGHEGGGGDLDELFGPFFAKLKDSLEPHGLLAQTLGVSASALMAGVAALLRPFLSLQGVPDTQAQAYSTLAMGMWEWFTRLTGADTSMYQAPWDQARNLSYPTAIPSPGEITGQYLAGEVSESDWRCGVRMSGMRDDLLWPSVHAARLRPDWIAVIDLWRRGIIDLGERDKRLRDLGVTDATDQRRLLESRDAVPTPGDIISMMTRDADDPRAVAAGRLDDEFAQKFQGQLKAWAKANGVSERHMQYLWRSHWSYPSNTQLYEMIRRLRPGRTGSVDVPDGRGGVVTEEVRPVTIPEAYEMLGINDVAPGWRAREIAVSYVPINLTTIRTAHRAGTMDGAEVRERLQDIGYSQADAETVAAFIEIESARQTQSALGAWTPRAIMKAYVDGTLTRTEASDLLGRSIISQEQVSAVLDDGDTLRRTQVRSRCIKGVRRRYFTGAITEGEAIAILGESDVSPRVAAQMGAGWRCERESRSKEPMANKVQTWYKQGLLNVDGFRSRLINLGYELSDVDTFIQSADKELLDARLKAEAQRVKEISAAQERARAKSEAEKRRQEAKAERLRKEAEKRAKEAKKEAEKRAKEEEKRRKEQEGESG